MAAKLKRKKGRDLMHTVTYKRQNGRFNVEWYLGLDKTNWVLPKILTQQAKKLGNGLGACDGLGGFEHSFGVGFRVLQNLVADRLRAGVSDAWAVDSS